MKRRFFIAVDGMSSEAETAMVAFFKKNSIGWWHRVPNFWLLVDNKDTMTTKILRDKVKELRSTNSKPCLVMQIEDDVSWSGLYPSINTKRNEFDWLKSPTWTGD